MDKKIGKLNIDNISGRKKDEESLLHPFQERYLMFTIDLIPKWLQTNHLTLITIFWSVLTILGGYLSIYNKWWIIFCALANIGQYFTDFWDGEIGRKRKTGLILWGFLVDHFLDFVFGCADVIALGLILRDYHYFIMAGLVVTAGSFLLEMHKCNLFGKYDVHGYNGIGGIEIKLITVIMFILAIILPRNVFFVIVVVVFGLSTFQLIWQFYLLQKKIWKIDMKNKDSQL